MHDTRLELGGSAPLTSYSTLSFTFLMGLGTLCALGVARRRFEQPLRMSDTLLLGAATHKLSRIVTRERVTMPLRKPFAKQQDEGRGHGGFHEEPKAHGMHRALGELLTCPFCVAPWISLGLLAGFSVAPRAVRIASTLFSMAAISDGLNLAYKRLGTRPSA